MFSFYIKCYGIAKVCNCNNKFTPRIIMLIIKQANLKSSIELCQTPLYNLYFSINIQFQLIFVSPLSKNIDLLNIFLILIAGVLAYIFPLELFIFSFAILGPLHYLTEINWLSSKNYFTTSKEYFWPFIAIAASLILVVPKLYLGLVEDHSSDISHLLSSLNYWSNGAIFICLMLAIGLIYFRKKRQLIIMGILAIVGAILFNQFESYTLFIGILVPTVIHVYVFTLLFMLFGAKKSKSKLGFTGVIIAIAIPLLYSFIALDLVDYSFDDSLKSTYIENNLHTTPVLFAKFIGLSDGKTFFFYEDLELRLMMFMSFIYLYHYLNWFSKTTTISWHKNLTMKRSIVILILWAIMLLLFYFDFKLGFLIALFFSFLHVILEFPLNILSIKSLLSANRKDT